jgi:hypothetical protein
MSETLIVAGMHRSGTSLTAGWLETCGLFLGSTLIPPDPTNPRGHFEDRTISTFQREILAENGLHHYLVLPGETIQIAPRFYEQARTLIAEQHGTETHTQWGWKDPRTTLLLDFWKEILPDAKVLIVYRSYTQVVDSLTRREERKTKGKLKKLRLKSQQPIRDYRFLQVWQRYNQDAIAFAQRHPQDTLLLSTETLLEQSLSVLSYLNETWGFDLASIDIRETYDESLFQQKPMQLRQLYHRLRLPEVDTTMDQLAELEQHSLNTIRECCT